MTVHLLDVNVLIALVDPAHVQHDVAHRWFSTAKREGWASCPITENGLLRILGNPAYPNSPGSPASAVPLLRGLRALRGHEFWPDEPSLLDSKNVDPDRILAHAQVTDTYLLALACSHGGKLASFDRRMSTAAVRQGDAALTLI